MCASHIVFKDYKINHTNQKKPFKSGYNIFNGIIFFLVSFFYNSKYILDKKSIETLRQNDCRHEHC